MHVRSRRGSWLSLTCYCVNGSTSKVEQKANHENDNTLCVAMIGVGVGEMWPEGPDHLLLSRWIISHVVERLSAQGPICVSVVVSSTEATIAGCMQQQQGPWRAIGWWAEEPLAYENHTTPLLMEHFTSKGGEGPWWWCDMYGLHYWVKQ